MSHKMLRPIIVKVSVIGYIPLYIAYMISIQNIQISYISILLNRTRPL